VISDQFRLKVEQRAGNALLIDEDSFHDVQFVANVLQLSQQIGLRREIIECLDKRFSAYSLVAL